MIPRFVDRLIKPGSLMRRQFLGGLRRFSVERHVYAEQVCIRGSHRVIIRGEPVTIASPSDDDFLQRSSHYRLGWFVRNDICTAEIPNALVQVGKGIVCDRFLRLVAEHGFENRLNNLSDAMNFRKLKPEIMRGNYAMINHPYAGNFGHWMIDCIPRIITLEMAYPFRPVVFLMPEDSNEFQRETLDIVLPPHFSVKYLDRDLWVRPEKLFWASPASAVENYMLPSLYFQGIRSRIFARYGLAEVHQMTKRIYISRRKAKYRRIINEVAVQELLLEYGFESVDLETLSFRRQVELFHQCEILVAPHGAGVCTSIFSGPISILVLYATQSPPNFFHTQAKGLGQKHFYMCGNSRLDDDDFVVDLGELRRKLDEMLACGAPGALIPAERRPSRELTDF